MTDIALAFLCVGLVASNFYLRVNGKESDPLVSWIAFISAIIILI